MCNAQPGTIGRALGRQGEKILYYTALMDKELEKYHALLQQQQQQQRQQTANHGDAGAAVLEEIAAKHNELREHALKSRWELTVHRQAAGFIVNNYKDVEEHHPIGAKLTVDDKPVQVQVDGGDGASASAGLDGSTAEETAAQKPEEKKFGDQLDWWQTIGRWRGG
jgi:uncharacterized membrane-anchored protein YhcB (DUF1043 family)